MDQQEQISYQIENIDDAHKLYYRIHQINIDLDITDPKLRIKPSAFDPQPKPHSVEMSVNWEKYADAEFTKNQAKKPELNGVLSFTTINIKNSPVNLKVSHKPTRNQSHSIIHEVLSEKNDPEIRMNLRSICNWEIKI